MDRLTGHTQHLHALAVAPDGGTLYSLSFGQQTIWSWDLATRRPGRKLRGGGHPSRVEALAISPRGDVLASADRGAIVFWPLTGAAPPHTILFSSHSDLPRPALAFHPEGRLVAAPLHLLGQKDGFRARDV